MGELFRVFFFVSPLVRVCMALSRKEGEVIGGKGNWGRRRKNVIGEHGRERSGETNGNNELVKILSFLFLLFYLFRNLNKTIKRKRNVYLEVFSFSYFKQAKT